MQCNAGYAKQRSYIFVYTWPSINGCGLSGAVCRCCETSWLRLGMGRFGFTKRAIDALPINFVRYLGDLGQPERKPRGRERVKPKGSVNWEDKKLSQIGRPEVRRMHNGLGANSGPYAPHRALELLRALFKFANRTGH